MGTPRWDYSKGQVIYYGPPASYVLSAELLDKPGWTVADWGCGACGARQHFKAAKYVGIDESPGFADVVADLREYRVPSDGVLIRHVLEHNYDWPVILKNALAAALRRLVVVLFLSPSEPESAFAPERDRIPALHISETRLWETLEGFRVRTFVLGRDDGTPHKNEWIYVVDKETP